MRHKSDGLTGRQAMVLDEVCRFVRQHGRSPMHRELSAALSLQLSTIQHIMRHLQVTGYIERKPYSRDYQVVKTPSETTLGTIPIVGFLKKDRVLSFTSSLGSVQVLLSSAFLAGIPLEELFALKVLQGGSLTTALCDEGCVLVFRKRNFATTCNTVIGSLNGETRLFKVIISRKDILLHSDGDISHQLRLEDLFLVKGILMLSFSSSEVTMA